MRGLEEMQQNFNLCCVMNLKSRAMEDEDEDDEL